jgi:hypothetical protein
MLRSVTRQLSHEEFIARDVRRRDNQDSAVIIKKIPLTTEEQADKDITSGAVLQEQISPIALHTDNYHQDELVSESLGDDVLTEFFGEMEREVNECEK